MDLQYFNVSLCIPLPSPHLSGAQVCTPSSSPFWFAIFWSYFVADEACFHRLFKLSNCSRSGRLLAGCLSKKRRCHADQARL